MSKSLLEGGAIAVLFSASLIFHAAPSVAETLAPTQQPTTQQTAVVSSRTETHETTPAGAVEVASTATEASAATLTRAREVNTEKPNATASTSITASTGIPVAPPISFVATAYNLRGRTASGRSTERGIIAADRRVLPLGTRVRLEAGSYSGEYLVADTGGAVRGRKIDIWVPSGSEAMRFGRRPVKLTVLTHERGNKAAPARARH